MFDCELRADGRTLTGVAVRYGDEANIWGGTERILAGALTWGDVILNVQHDRGAPLARTGGGGLVLEDGAESLTVRAELPRTRAADDVLELVRSGVLRGLSVGMNVKRDRWVEERRTVVEAVIRHIGVVDTPAYPDSAVAARAARRPRRVCIWL